MRYMLLHELQHYRHKDAIAYPFHHFHLLQASVVTWNRWMVGLWAILKLQIIHTFLLPTLEQIATLPEATLPKLPCLSCLTWISGGHIPQICDSYGSRQMDMQAYPLSSLLAEIEKSGKSQTIQSFTRFLFIFKSSFYVLNRFHIFFEQTIIWILLSDDKVPL